MSVGFVSSDPRNTNQTMTNIYSEKNVKTIQKMNEIVEVRCFKQFTFQSISMNFAFGIVKSISLCNNKKCFEQKKDIE